MAITSFAHLSTHPLLFPVHHHHHSSLTTVSLFPTRVTTTYLSTSPLKLNSHRNPYFLLLATGNGSDYGTSSGGGGGSDRGGGGGGGDGGGGEDGDAGERNKAEAILALAEVERSLESIPKDLAAAIEAGRIPGSIVYRYFELEKSPVFRWLLQFGGFKERLLADDLFLAKVAMECGVGIFTKTAAELERRREKFTKELDFVFADVGSLKAPLLPAEMKPFTPSRKQAEFGLAKFNKLVMAIIADFMLVWLPAPTVFLRPPLAISAGPLAKFFYSCPDNAFQVALAGTSYSFLQRIGAIVVCSMISEFK
ncbi:unnamed protein product [Ilex paraguariensis]|uniref:Uncharacterized protein n=1 Tax=Ilex paraguariensis TaxID=185542 RepID=A0ABC8RRC7_9AQUA